MLLNFILICDFGFLILAFILFFESYFEQEKRAAQIGLGGVAIALIIGLSAIVKPFLQLPLGIIFGLSLFFAILFCLPWKQNSRALKGTIGYIVGNVTRFFEPDSVFARTRSLPEGSDIYKQYYEMRPGQEERDKERRAKGILGKPGSIDGGYRPNLAMLISADEMPDFLGQYAISEPASGSSPADMDPEKATQIVKNYAKHLGADLVGVCKVNPNWIYSHRGEIHHGNWEEWGKEIKDIPPFAIVMVTEMARDAVISAPHVPAASESTINYAKGAYLGTMLAKWLQHMGYRGVAQHTRNYDVILPPLAVDAGLGEIGRQGYLIAPKFGARSRVFAVLTDMPLLADKPISLGVEEFCEKCMKCAESCPSRSIPKGEKTICRGVEKWKLNEESCYAYWSRVGTDCAICMAICPFSRPNSYFHRSIRWLIAHSPLAKSVFPHIDNLIYGKRWKTKKVPDWLTYPKRSEMEDYPTDLEDLKY